MSRSPGLRLGPYEVIAKLGAGGMGDPAGDDPLAWTSDGLARLTWDRTLRPRIYRTALADGRRELVREIVTPDPVGVLYAWLTLSPGGNFYLQRYRRVLSNAFLVTLH